MDTKKYFIETPYFLINEEWYYWDKATDKYKLTDKAPPKAIESYEEFYKQLKDENE